MFTGQVQIYKKTYIVNKLRQNILKGKLCHTKACISFITVPTCIKQLGQHNIKGHRLRVTLVVPCDPATGVTMTTSLESPFS